MLDIKFIRENPEKVKTACKDRGMVCDVDMILSLDQKRRSFIQEIEGLRAQQNKLGLRRLQTGQLAEAQNLKQQIKQKESELENVEQEFQKLLLQLPNIPLEDVPVGKDETANKVVREWGKQPTFPFQPKDHVALGENLGLIDVERAAKVAGSRFAFLKNDLVLLEFALVDLILKTAVKEKFIPVVPPVLLKQEAMKAMGYLDTPQDLAERYFLEKDKLFLAGTSEHSVGAMHKDEVFNEKDLPRRYVAFSTCFREEAGSYGKDTKGILRVHQFDKVEFVSFTMREESKKELEFLVKLEEKLWQMLKIPYRVVQLCTGDLARPSAITFDIEAWLPGQQKYREMSSASNTTDFQARRLNTRFRGKAGILEYVHILNATGFAIGRTLIAILENYQQKEGSVKIPKVLQRYVGKSEIKNRVN